MYDKCYFCLDQLPKLKKESTASFFRKFWRSRGTKEPAYITVVGQLTNPQGHYVLGDNGKPERVPEDEDEEEEVDNQNEISADNRVAETVTIQEEETLEVVLDHKEEEHHQIEIKEA